MANKMDWKKYVEESNGSAILLPSDFTTQQDKMEKLRQVFNAEAVKMAEKEIRMSVENNNLFLKIREHLAKNGHPEIWVKEIGFNAAALAEGVFIINVREGRPGQSL